MENGRGTCFGPNVPLALPKDVIMESIKLYDVSGASMISKYGLKFYDGKGSHVCGIHVSSAAASSPIDYVTRFPIELMYLSYATGAPGATSTQPVIYIHDEMAHDSFRKIYNEIGRGSAGGIASGNTSGNASGNTSGPRNIYMKQNCNEATIIYILSSGLLKVLYSDMQYMTRLVKIRFAELENGTDRVFGQSYTYKIVKPGAGTAGASGCNSVGLTPFEGSIETVENIVRNRIAAELAKFSDVTKVYTTYCDVYTGPGARSVLTAIILAHGYEANISCFRMNNVGTQRFDQIL